MPTSWHYKSLGQDFGPVSFRDLTHMVRAGALAPEDLVRPDYDERWQRADEVPGLLHMAHTVQDEPESVASASEVDALDFFTEADIAELVPADEQPAWMRQILARMWSGAAVSDSEKERVFEFLSSGDSQADANAFPAEAGCESGRRSEVAGSGDGSSIGAAHDDCDLAHSAVGALLAEMEAEHDAELAASAAKRSGWRFSLHQVARDRWLWTQIMRVGGAMLCANVAFLWLQQWSAREALRFPGLIETRGARIFPVIGSCSPTEFWFFTMDLLLVGAVGGYAAVRWVQRHLD